MAADLSLAIKGSVINQLMGDGDLMAIVQDRIYGLSAPANPTFPFIKYGSAISTPYDATCWTGSSVRVTLHAFAESTDEMAGEDAAYLIAGLIQKAMSDYVPDDIDIIESEWLQTNVIRDGDEADRYHAIIEFQITAIEQ
ncbi:DUF3168 domain-containing protein [Bartonella sp. LJL80]